MVNESSTISCITRRQNSEIGFNLSHSDRGAACQDGTRHRQANEENKVMNFLAWDLQCKGFALQEARRAAARQTVLPNKVRSIFCRKSKYSTMLRIFVVIY